MKGDIYQSLAADSLMNNKITLIKGPAGSGKTFLSLAFLMHKLERNKIDRIIVFCNTVATKNSAKLGYYPGTRDEKLLDSQIGNLLISKFGGRLAVEQMIQQEKLVLLPLSDIRGYDTSGMCAGIYISEAQNMDVELMKLTLQRIGEDSICIIDGDCKTQVDDVHFAGSSNGMKRASQVYRGEDVYGEITLKNIHRSRIAKIAEKM
jgi:predicted ribonuclease YlaK